MKQLTKEQIVKVSKLLLSADDANTILAFEILEHHTFSTELITELFAIYKLGDEPFKETSSNLLKRYASAKVQEKMTWKFSLGKGDTTEKRIKTNIKKYTDNDEQLDGFKIGMALYRKFGVGLAYLLDECPPEFEKELIDPFIKGTVATITNKGLTRFPKALFSRTELTEIDLSYNEIGTIPSQISKLGNLKILRINDNMLVSLQKKLGQLQNLEELYVQRNYMAGLIDPAVFTMPNLRILDMHRLRRYGLEYESLPDTFFQLQKIESITFGEADDLQNYINCPQFDKLEGNPVQMDPMAIAEAVYAQGKKSSVNYLLNHASEPRQIEVLRDFYDPRTKTLDLSKVYLNQIPDSVRQFDIEHFNFENCYIGSGVNRLDSDARDKESFKRIKVLESFPNLISLNLNSNGLSGALFFGSFKYLHELRLADNSFHQVCGLSRLPQLSILDLSKNDIDDLDHLELDKLSNLGYLYLKDAFWYHMALEEEIPAQIGQLQQLKEFHFLDTRNNLTDEDNFYTYVLPSILPNTKIVTP